MITTKIIIRTIELVPSTTTVETIDQSQLNFDRSQNYYSSLYRNQQNKNNRLISWVNWIRSNMRHFFKPPRLKEILWSNKIPIEWKCQKLFYSKLLWLLFQLHEVQQIFVVYQHGCVVVVSFNFKYFLCSIKWINDSLVRHWGKNLFDKVFILHVCGGNYFAGKYSLAMAKFSLCSDVDGIGNVQFFYFVFRFSVFRLWKYFCPFTNGSENSDYTIQNGIF